MARVLAVVGALLVLLIGGLSLAIYLSRDEDNVAIDNLLSEDFTRAVGLAEDPESGTHGIVDLRDYARFGWDHVVIVEPDTPNAAISRRLGFEWKGIVGINSGPLLIFLRHGRLARFADYRGNGFFYGIPRPFAELPRSRAVFVVHDQGITVRR